MTTVMHAPRPRLDNGETSASAPVPDETENVSD